MAGVAGSCLPHLGRIPVAVARRAGPDASAVPDTLWPQPTRRRPWSSAWIRTWQGRTAPWTGAAAVAEAQDRQQAVEDPAQVPAVEGGVPVVDLLQGVEARLVDEDVDPLREGSRTGKDSTRVGTKLR